MCPNPDKKPPRPIWPFILAGGGALVVCVIVIIVLATRGSSSSSGNRGAMQAQLKIADERVASGRLVAPDGDDALAHLLAARKLDPSSVAVRDRLRALAHTYEELADQALAA